MDRFIKKISLYLQFVLSAFCILQIVTYFSISNILGCAVSLFCFSLFRKYVLRMDVLEKRPIASLSMLPIMMFTYFAPIITYLEGHELSYRMINPSLTFILQCLYVCITYLAFVHSYKKKNTGGLRKVLNKYGYFKPAGDRVLWILGILGVLGRIYILLFQTGTQSAAGTGTITMIFIPFLSAPYCILFNGLYGKEHSISKITKIALLIYTLLLTALAVASNTRNAIVMIFISVILMAIVHVIVCKPKYIYKLQRITLKKVLYVIIGLYFVSGPMTDFAIAMVAVRYTKGDMPASEIFKETYDLATDKEKMKLLRKTAESVSSGNSDISISDLQNEWSEDYIDNVFLNRVCNYQVADATLYHAMRLGFLNNEFLDFCGVKFKLLFPTPIIRFFFGNINKEDYNYTYTDLLYAKSTRNQIKEAHIVGGDVGLGYETFSFLFPIFQFFIYCLIFKVMDQITIIKNNRLTIPIITMVSLYGYFYTFMVGTGVYDRFLSFFWGVPIGFITKILVFNIVNKLFAQKIR